MSERTIKCPSCGALMPSRTLPGYCDACLKEHEEFMDNLLFCQPVTPPTFKGLSGRYKATP